MKSAERILRPRCFEVAAAVCVGLCLSAGAACGKYTRIVVPFDHRPKRADVLVVPGVNLTETGRARGLLHNRVAMAKLLLDDGLAEKLLLTGGKPKNGISEAARMTQVALDMGIPMDAIILEPEADTSVQNGLYTAQAMARLGLRSAVVVTDLFHLAYALPVFRDAFEQYDLDLYWVSVDNARLAAAGRHRSYAGPL